MYVLCIVLQLNLCRYRRARYSYLRTSANIQVPGFSDCDTYSDVVARGAQGLGITANIENLQLVVSGGVVNDSPLQGGESWTLGGYVKEMGGQAVRGKKTFGIHVMDSADEDDIEEVGLFKRWHTQPRRMPT